MAGIEDHWDAGGHGIPEALCSRASMSRQGPCTAASPERRADLAEEDHRRVREASLRSGESLRMRFRCETSLPVDVIGLIVLLPAPVL